MAQTADRPRRTTPRLEHGPSAALVAALLAAAGASGPAEAQLWDPLESKLKPILNVALDTSATMDINYSCNNCHGSDARLHEVKSEVRSTMEMFQDYFVYGGYTYRGCGRAHIHQRVPANVADPATSYANVDAMVAGAGACGRSERSVAAAQNCLTAYCVDEDGAGNAVITNPPMGFTPPPPPTTYSPTCDNGAMAGSTLDLSAQLTTQLATLSWPRWNGSPTGSDVTNGFCNPLRAIFSNIEVQLNACLTNPTAVWDLAGWLSNSSNCSPGTIAATACTSSSLASTCVCDSSADGCDAVASNSECGVPLEYRARQQVAMCEAYSAVPGRVGRAMRDDPNNVINGRCRENALVMLTDSYPGVTAGFRDEADNARAVYRSSNSGEFNMFLFHVSPIWGPGYSPDLSAGMAAAMPPANGNPVYNADDSASMMDSFVRIVNRMYRGAYAGSFTIDRYEQRMYKHSFTVPSGPTDRGERYLGRPTRISAYQLDAAGNVTGGPIWETDWATRATGAPMNVGGNQSICATGPNCTLTALEQQRYGSTGTFRNGVARGVNVPANSTDRNGVGGADTHPPLFWGPMLGNGASQPVVVDAPRDLPGDVSGQDFQTFAAQPAVANRARVVYVASNTFIHGIYAGSRTNRTVNAGAIGGSGLDWGPAYVYSDGGANGGREMFRYFPRSWMPTVTNSTLNDVVQRPLITGQMVARDMHVETTGTVVNRFRTVLAVAQGRAGRGLATLDISNPQAPRVMAEWLLPPGNFASNEPMLYQFPPENTAARRPRPVVVVTGGLGGTNNLYAYDIRTGTLLSSIGLPGGGSDSYPTEPACLDAAGRGAVTVCYVLSESGRLSRVDVNPTTGAFGPVTQINGALASDPRGGGRSFHTRPVAFYGADGSVNIVFGSGRATQLANPDVPNFVYKVVDPTNRLPSGTPTNSNVCTIAGAPRSGVIPLGAGERLISPPVIAKGVVAWTTFAQGATACDSGAASLYAMDFQTCADVTVAGSQLPAARPIGSGIPASPTILRSKGAVVTQTSGQLTNASTQTGVRTRGGNLSAFRPLFWRPLFNVP